MTQVPVTQKEIKINPDFVSKLDTKFLSNDLNKLIRNETSEFGTDANKLGELAPDIAVQIKNAPWHKDRFSRSPFKDILDIWSFKPRHLRGTIFPLD